MENENSNRQITNLAFVISAFLTYFIVSVLFQTLAETFGPVARIYANEGAKHGIPVLSGLAMFVGLMFNPKVHLFADECVTEIRRVVWPSRRDTIAMTTICCVMVVVAGIGFGVFDFLSSQLIKVFVH